jgi:hypothetical protein
MHHRLLITLKAPTDADSATVRNDVYNRLMSDDSFVGEGGRFGSPLCDWFVIGGRWSGYLAEIVIGESYKNALFARLPEFDRDFLPRSLVDRHRADLDELWRIHGGTGPSPYSRSGYEDHGYPDDAMPLTAELYKALLARFENRNDEGHADLDDEALQPDFVGRKWLVVVDYHN